MKPTRLFASLLFVAMVAGCTATNAPETTPAASTSTISTPDTDGVVTRFTKDIWPAVEGYRAPGQGSPSYRRYVTIVDPQLEGTAWNALFEDVRSLGTVGRNKETDEAESYPTGPLNLAATSATALDASTATLVICYTYTSVTQRTVNDPQVQAPAASEATFELAQVNNVWYLHSVTNDHVVPDCQSSKA